MGNRIVRCTDCVMRARGLLAGVPQATFERISCVMQRYRFPARHRIYLEGNPCERIGSIRQGLVKLSKQAGNGRTQILGVAGPGFLLGYEALHEQTCASTAEALTDVEVCMAPREALARQLREYPEVALGLVYVLAQRVRELEGMALQLGTLSARQRLAAHLLALHEAQTAGAAEVAGRLRRQELADVLGMAKETVIRLLSGLAEDGTVALEGPFIAVRDPGRLRRVLAANA